MNTPLRAFHGEPEIKQKYISRLAEHRRLEHLVQGTGWEHDGDAPKGCAVGCTLEQYDHARYPIELGLPEWLARLEDFIFEQLPKGEAEQFAVDFLAAIPVGADVEPVRHKLGVARIDASLERLKENKEPYADECRNALNLVKAWHLSQIDGKTDDLAAESARSAAESAAESAARSAGSAGSDWSAARSAWSAAWSAARSAGSAARSVAESAARSARSARSAAESAERAYLRWEADTLLSLLGEAQ